MGTTQMHINWVQGTSQIGHALLLRLSDTHTLSQYLHPYLITSVVSSLSITCPIHTNIFKFGHHLRVVTGCKKQSQYLNPYLITFVVSSLQCHYLSNTHKHLQIWPSFESNNRMQEAVSVSTPIPDNLRSE